MARSQDVLNRIRAALVLDAKRLKELSEEMEQLAEAHNRYLALQREAEEHEKSVQGLKALLGHDWYYRAMRSDDTAAIGEELDVYPSAAQLRKDAAIWEHVARYLRFVSEAQVGEIVAFFDWLGIEANRQAIESAIRTHSHVFGIKKRGRNKFVYLK